MKMASVCSPSRFFGIANWSFHILVLLVGLLTRCGDAFQEVQWGEFLLSALKPRANENYI